MKRDKILLLVFIALMGVLFVVSKINVSNTAQTRVLLPKGFDGFSEGLTPVRLTGFLTRETDNYGYVDTTGKVVIKPQYDMAAEFSEGLALVKVDDKYGFIDKTGEMVISPQFEYAADFSDGLARVRTDFFGKYGFIDRTGKLIIDTQYDYAADFSDGLALVKIDDRHGYIDKVGDWVKEASVKSN